MYDNDRLDRIMAATHVTDLWGVAGRTAKRLAPMNIMSVKDLQDADERLIRKQFSVVLQRTAYELRGIPCIPLEEETKLKDQMIFSRSFAKPVTTAEEMQQVLSIYAEKVSTRLRAEGQVTGVVSAWAMTGHYVTEGRHSAHVAVLLPTPTNDPVGIAKAANALLPRLQHGARYARAGVVLTDLTPATNLTPLALFQPEYEGRGIGETLDNVRDKLGPEVSIGVGRGGLKKPPAWNMRRAMMPPEPPHTETNSRACERGEIERAAEELAD